MGYEVRQVRPEEWRESRELRLVALQDPASSVAFARTYEEEAAFPDEVWQRRVSGVGAQQFVAVDEGGVSVGTLTVFEEKQDYWCIVRVYVRPEHRGTGLAVELFEAAVAWTWQRVDRVCLWVHEDNPRAQALYTRMGFVRTGKTMAFELDETQTDYEMLLTRSAQDNRVGHLGQ
jgi:GNAT superfamily N-acetyltransferase